MHSRKSAYLLTLIGILFIIGCSNDDPAPISNVNNRPVAPDSSFYAFGISDTAETSQTLTLLGNGVGASWNKSNGLVWLSTDDNGTSPYGTLTMTIQPTGIAEKFTIVSALLSMSDKLQGSGPEVNARLYSLVYEGGVTAYIVDGALIYGNLSMTMERISGLESNPDAIYIEGDFCAID